MTLDSISSTPRRAGSARALLHGALLALVLLLPGLARANQLFQDQTGQACVACHIAGMEQDGRNGLNSVGRAFSANGNRMPTGSQNVVPQMPQQGSGEVRWFKIVSRNSDKVMDVTSASMRDGANVQQWSYAGVGSPQQLWKFNPVGDGYVTVENQKSGKVLDVLNADMSNGANVQQWSYGGPNARNQHWKFIPVGDGYVRIENQKSGKVLDVVSAGRDNGANVQQWDYASAQSPQQHWRLEEVRAGPPATDTAVSAASTDFSRYAVKVDSIKITQPILSGKAADFKTKLREALQAARASGPNFAGHYVIAEWGCGSGCIQAAIIDTNIGAVYFPPQLQGTTGGSGELDSEAGTEHRADSRLLVIRGFPADGDRYGVWAYEWTGTALRPQGFTPKRGAP